MRHRFVQTSTRFLRSWIATAAIVTCVVALVALALAVSRDWVEYLAVGLAVSFAVSVAAEVAAHSSPVSGSPLGQLLVSTAIRTGIPLSTILAISVREPDLLGTEFLLYCLPTHLVTMIVGTRADLHRVQPSPAPAAAANRKGLTSHGS